VEFTTKGIDRVYVDETGSPARASLIKISTDCRGMKPARRSLLRRHGADPA
jgi:hypothetical protein